MGKLTEMAREKTQLSPLAVGQKLTTDDLVGKDIYITNADIVSYDEEKNGDTRTITFCVCTVADSKKKPLGYYQGGKALTNIMVDVVSDADLMNELQSRGLHIRLTNGRTKSGNNFTRVEVLD